MPRSKSEPMSFTRAEFRRGAVAAWCAFMILLSVVLIVVAIQQSGLPWGPPLATITLYLMFGLPVGGVIAAVITVVASPAAWVIGRALRRTRRVAVHLVAYVAFGAALGGTTLLLSVLIASGDLHYALTSPIAWLTPLMCALAVAGGWTWALRRIDRRPQQDTDAAHEDSV